MNVPKIIYIGAILICAFPFIDTPFALLIGIILAQTIKHPFQKTSKKLTHILLQVSVVGLGFGMNAWQALDAGKQGLLFTIFSITTTLTLGLFIGKRLKVENNTSYLISTGTAICGGSAIAAISTIVKSNEKQISTALGTVFVLEFSRSFSISMDWPSLKSFSASIWSVGCHRHSRYQFGSWCSQPIWSRSAANSHHHKTRKGVVDYPIGHNLSVRF